MADISNDGNDDFWPSRDRAARILMTVAVVAGVLFGTWFFVAGVVRNPAPSLVGDEQSVGRNDRLDEPLPRFERKEVPTRPDPQQKKDEPGR